MYETFKQLQAPGVVPNDVGELLRDAGKTDLGPIADRPAAASIVARMLRGCEVNVGELTRSMGTMREHRRANVIEASTDRKGMMPCALQR